LELYGEWIFKIFGMIEGLDSSWTLFLDRDGVINERKPGDYIKVWDEFSFIPGVLKAMQIFEDKFYKIIVVTNQQGIGKGLMSEYDLLLVHKMMMKTIYLLGGKVDAVYHCPSLAAENNPSRKPNTGMGLQAKSQFEAIDFQKSIMIGDSESDILFGKNLGMKTILIKGKGDKILTNPDFEMDSLIEVATNLFP
jgi:histidinol-phosphate phosphatase family protein